MFHISDKFQLDLAAIGMALFVWGRYVVIKSKLIALKEFKDKEMIRVTDHFNAQLQTFEHRMKKIQEAFKEGGVEVNLTKVDYAPDPNAELSYAAQQSAIKEQIITYNKAFEDWGVGDYATGNKQTFLKPSSK